MKIALLNGAPEIFYTIQGEGRSLGMPSIFVRASLCNLHCRWCDTDYTWNWEGTRFEHVRDTEPTYVKFKMEEQSQEIEPRAVAMAVRAYPCRNVVITGGEPMMQQEDWVAVMQELRQHDNTFRFEVETNGTIIPTTEFDAYIVQYNVSPKLSHSGNSRRLREKPEALTFFSQHPQSFFKFVLASPDDLEEILDMIFRYNIPAEKIYLMPEGTRQEDLRQRQQWLVEICKQYGFYYTDRLHIHIYGDKRGV